MLVAEQVAVLLGERRARGEQLVAGCRRRRCSRRGRACRRRGRVAAGRSARSAPRASRNRPSRCSARRTWGLLASRSRTRGTRFGRRARPTSQSGSAVLPPAPFGAAPVPDAEQRDRVDALRDRRVGLRTPSVTISGRDGSPRCGRATGCTSSAIRAPFGVSYLIGFPSRMPWLVGPRLVERDLAADVPERDHERRRALLRRREAELPQRGRVRHREVAARRAIPALIADASSSRWWCSSSGGSGALIPTASTRREGRRAVSRPPPLRGYYFRQPSCSCP